MALNIRLSIISLYKRLGRLSLQQPCNDALAAPAIVFPSDQCRTHKYPFYCYSTDGTSKQLVNVFDVLADLLSFNVAAVKSFDDDMPPVKCLESEHTNQHHIDTILGDVDVSNVKLTEVTLMNELYGCSKAKDWRSVAKILHFLIQHKVVLKSTAIDRCSNTFASAGFINGNELLHSLCTVTDVEASVRGNILYNLSKCYWSTNNAKACLQALQDCCDNHGESINAVKRLLRIIIHEAVSNRSEAVVVSVAHFVEQFCQKHKDYYPMTILWHDMFHSEWFAHQQRSQKLFEEHEPLKECVTILCPTLIRNFLRANNTADVYRLLELFLHFKMMKSYSNATQMMFDHYCKRGDKSRCGEIIKASVSLDAPLREEQYEQFISWSISGNPFKFVKFDGKRADDFQVLPLQSSAADQNTH